jgi:hypothetical protein
LPSSRRGGFVIAAIVGALLAASLAAGALIVLPRSNDSGMTTNPAPMDPAPGAPADDVVADDGPDSGPGTTSIEPTTSTEATTTTTTEPVVSSESDALARLEEIVDDDEPSVIRDVVGRWVPQISSKKPDVTLSDGTVWDAIAILEDHEAWRSQFPDARLLWSGDYSTFEASDFWVTIVAIPFDTPESALSWCDAQGLPTEDCYAKLISHTHPNENSTRHR